jgi:hypothetical protein
MIAALLLWATNPVSGDLQPAGPAGGGAALDIPRFRFAREIPPGRPGLVSLRPDALVLGHSWTPYLHDLRIAAADGRQVPYVLERLPEPFSVDLPALKALAAPPGTTAIAKDAAGGRSYYRLVLPCENLPEARLVLRTTAAVFERGIKVGAEWSGGGSPGRPPMRWLAWAIWRHADPTVPAPDLVLQLPDVPARELVLIVDEGDNPPLPLDAPRLLLPAWRLRFIREAGAACLLLYGRGDLGPPRYDLALFSTALAGDAEEATLGAERETRPSPARSSIPAAAFWIVLIASVLILLVLIVRLVRPGS